VTSAFLTPLRNEHVREGIYRLYQPLRYRSRTGIIYDIEAGFEYDGCSVPRPLWWLYPPFGGAYDEAVILHDKLYRHAEMFPGSDHGHISRGTADDLMLEGMETMRIKPIDGIRIHQGVRLGGWHSWRKHRNFQSTQRVKGLPQLQSRLTVPGDTWGNYS
jgi:hypothetical protein